MEQEIVNRVAKSTLVSIDLENYLDKSEQSFLDLKQTLFQEMILKEKEFRQFVREHPWSQYQGKNVGVYCSADAIIPSWAYMLVAAKLQPVARALVFGGPDELEKVLIDDAIARLFEEGLNDAKVVIKGCGKIKNREYAYFQLAKKLTPVVSSLMYGEPCSTVPVYKKPKG